MIFLFQQVFSDQYKEDVFLLLTAILALGCPQFNLAGGLLLANWKLLPTFCEEVSHNITGWLGDCREDILTQIIHEVLPKQGLQTITPCKASRFS